ncbi:serine proteinase stubble isoform X1 [Plodia interpunctella]|uniref:serine proteinase stubble isoform X1 n=1 Tax=Plodia interpunctella TaxID=58824 RepID=UPI002368116D|nr:serine proteinase stubble isoform X1 [Plodia interpunctella]
MHAARAPGVVVMLWWWALALLALAAPARPAPRAGNGELYYSYQMSRKSCVAGGARGACMWVQECNRVGGTHAGVCVDGFMFGSCCRLPDKPLALEETSSAVAITERPYTPPSSGYSSTSLAPQTTQTISRPSFQTQRPSFMTKPIDGAPSSHSYRPPEINLPSLGNLDTSSEQNSDIVNKISYNSVNKYQNVNRPSEEASPHNKISSSHIIPGARPMAVSEQHAENSVSSAQFMSRPSNLNTIHWQATTEPSFITKPRPSSWEKPAGKPKPTKKFTTTTSKPHKNYVKPKDPSLNMINKTDETTVSPVQTTAATASAECGLTAMWPRPETRIMGGKDSSFGRWPWQVSVRRTSFFGFSSTHRCGGAIINEGWIATAGHCVDDLLTAQIRIRVGEYDFSSVSEQYPYVERGVARKAVHPKYNFFTYEYDLALVKLEAPVQFAPHISPICLPASDDLLVGENATVTGWGRLSEGGVLPSILQEVQVPIVSNERCKSMFLRAGRHEFIPDIFLCAGHERGGHDSCQGDSGGPLQVKGKDSRYFLAGIISWGIGCGEANLPGVCTRISKFVPWILQTVNS